MTDARSRLQHGDALLRAGRYAEAVAEYDEAARAFAEAGFALKAVAVSRQIVEIIERSAPQLTDMRTRALRRLLDGYAALGLTTEAEEVRRRLS